jgi:hypothetical protein
MSLLLIEEEDNSFSTVTEPTDWKARVLIPAGAGIFLITSVRVVLATTSLCVPSQ